MSESGVSGVINKARVQLSKRQRSVCLEMVGQRVIELFRRKAELLRDPVEVNTTEQKVLCTVAGNQVLNVAGKALIKVKVSIPGGTGIPSYRSSSE